MNEPSVPRRQFLRHSAWAAAILGGTAVGASASSTPFAATAPAGFLDARDYGARGDGQNDDTAGLHRAIRAASEQEASGVFLPTGIYLLSDALVLPSNFQLIGAGRASTILRAASGTRFPLYRPDPRTVDLRQRRTMLTTAGAGSVRGNVTRNVCVADLTLDWNECPTDGFGHSAALMDSVDHAILRNIDFIRCLPSDHPRVDEEVRAGGANFRCECIMYSNARYGLIERCYLTDSGYRPLSVSYGSLGIVFREGVIHAERPVWRHAFSENHGDGIPRDETFVHSQIIFKDSTFLLEGGTPADGICSHTGTTVVDNCDFFIREAPPTFAIVIRAFDGSVNCTYTRNRFHCGGSHPAAFSLVATTPRTSPGREDNQAILVQGNIAEIGFGPPRNDRRRALFHFQGTDRRVRVADNIVRARWASAAGAEVIRLVENSTFAVTGNLIEVEAEAGRPDGIVVDRCRQGVVSGNVVTGPCRHGFHRIGENPHLALSANVFPEAEGEEAAD